MLNQQITFLLQLVLGSVPFLARQTGLNSLNQTKTAFFTLLLHISLHVDHITLIYYQCACNYMFLISNSHVSLYMYVFTGCERSNFGKLRPESVRGSLLAQSYRNYQPRQNDKGSLVIGLS